MILSGRQLYRINQSMERGFITPYFLRQVSHGMSFGESLAGYDIRVAQSFWISPRSFRLASSVEKFNMPLDLVGRVCDKSSWARKGLSVFNTVIEPGWKGFLTLELVNNSNRDLKIEQGMPIAQILFEKMSEPVVTGYDGKYQNQPDFPVPAIDEKD